MAFGILVYVVLLVLLQFFLPWWSLAVVAFFAGWLLSRRADRSSWRTSLLLAVASGLVWLVPALYLHTASLSASPDVLNNTLPQRMADMLGVGQVSLVFVITFAIAFAVAFLAALAGSMVTASRSH